MPRMKEPVRPRQDEEDDGFDPNESMEDFRARVGRIIRVIIAEEREDWRHCPHGNCRRNRACGLPGGECAVPLPPVEMTEAQQTYLTARLQRCIPRAIAALDAQGWPEPSPPRGWGTGADESDQQS